MDNHEELIRDWTVMVYFAGENRLFDEMIYSLKDLKRIDPQRDWLSLLAQFSAKRVKKNDASPTSLATPRRFDLFTDRCHPAGSVAMNYLIPPIDDRRVSFVRELVEFIVWGIRTHPARKYMVVFAGDGGGTLSDFLPSRAKPPKSIKPRDLSKVFALVRKKLGNKSFRFDVVGLDSCLMSMTEIAFGLRKYAKYLVSSEGNEDDFGWPYFDALQILNCREHPVEARELASHIVDAYNTYYLDYALIAGASANLSAVNLRGMGGLIYAIRGFVKEALAHLPEDPDDLKPYQQIFVGVLVHTHWLSQTYRQDQYVDVGDFFKLLRDEINQITDNHSTLDSLKPVAAACQTVLDALDCKDSPAKAIVNSCHVGAKYQYSRGLSVYLPWSKVEPTYFQDDSDDDGPRLEAFVLATGWGKFIHRYTELSRRRPSDGMKDSEVPKKIVALMRRDPPDGRGFLPVEFDTATNPPTTWNVSGCVIRPLLESLNVKEDCEDEELLLT